MKFNKSLLSAALLLGLGVVTSANAAVDQPPAGKININGKIVNDTCTVTVNHTASSTGTITLPTVTVQQFSGTNPLGATPIFIRYEHCSPLPGSATYDIVPDFNIAANSWDASNANLLLNTGSATNVGVGLLLTAAGSPLPIHTVANGIPTQTVNSTTAALGLDFNLYAAYVPDGAGTPTGGTVVSVANFTTNYL